MNSTPSAASDVSLARHLGLLGLSATGICAMLGAAINIIPFMLQRSVPGIGPYVLAAYALGAVPAVMAALAYAILGSAMPRAGGSYTYASRSLSPFLGFVASFSHWFGLSIAIGVVSYMLVPFLRDVAAALDMAALAAALESGPIRVGVALAFLWTFTAINILGVKLYERTLVPLMLLMFLLGSIVIFAGFSHDQADFAAGLLAREGVTFTPSESPPFLLSTLLAASAILFSSFIGFDSIAQAGGEAKNPGRNLPLAVGIAIVSVGSFYMLFTAAVYHTVPWSFIAERAMATDLTAPGLLGYVLTPGWTVAIVAGAAVALINDLPAMLLSVSRLMFAWAEDGIFPRGVARVSRRFRTPHVALVLSALMASCGILGSHLAGDFFLGIDIMVTSMLVNFLLMCVSVVALPRRNPELAKEIRFGRERTVQLVIGVGGAVILAAFLVVHIVKDLMADLVAWYFHSTFIWIVVMSVASVVFVIQWRQLKRQGVDVAERFSSLPPQRSSSGGRPGDNGAEVIPPSYPLPQTPGRGVSPSSGTRSNKIMPKKHVFLSYCRENADQVERLRQDLVDAGLAVWWDQDILPGADWKLEIRQAIKNACAVVLCLSEEATARQRSGIFPEAREAIGIYRLCPPGGIFLIPARLSECEIPPIAIDDTLTLDGLQYIDLFPEASRTRSLHRLIASIRKALAP